ncbi:MAG: hypothetical protein EZS28_038590, partial [Streblomastix strix]
MYGAAIFMFLNNEGQTIISNSSFNKCEANDGGGVYAVIFSGGQMIIDGQCNFTECQISGQGGGLWTQNDGSLTIKDGVKFERCTSSRGGGIYVIQSNVGQLFITNSEFIQCKGSEIQGGAIYLSIFNGGYVTISNLSFNQCEAKYGGGIYAAIQSGGKMNIIGQCNFTDCKAETNGGGIRVNVSGIGSLLTLDDEVKFKNCSANVGGGIWSNVNNGGQISIKDQCLFTECKSISGNGGGIYSDINDGTLNIEDTTFDSCNCTQPGNGGALCLIQGSSSIISITNSSFINCKTISNSSYQRYGWGGAIFIQTLVTSENLIESKFQLTVLAFIGCSAVNSIGNNIHIRSHNTVGTGEAIEQQNLVTVNGTINLYYNNSYQQDYMGIDESKVGDGTIINNNIPLFSSLFLR